MAFIDLYTYFFTRYVSTSLVITQVDHKNTLSIIFCTSRVTGRSIHISHPLNQVSCSRFYVLRIKSNFERAPARQWSFASALVFFHFFVFVSIFFLPSRVNGHPLQKKELVARFKPSDVRVNTYEASINPQDHDALTCASKFGIAVVPPSGNSVRSFKTRRPFATFGSTSSTAS